MKGPTRRNPPGYPESDGKPIGDGTLHFDWITFIEGGFACLYRNDPDVFVAGALLWYPVEGHPEIVGSPDVMVAFGVPKGHRGSYLQWLDGVAPQVVFEILSYKSTDAEMRAKHAWYQEYGVEEYYVYDPMNNRLDVHPREGPLLCQLPEPHGFVSPRTGVRFDLSGPKLVLIKPNGERFLTFVEAYAELLALEKFNADRDRLASLNRKERQGEATLQSRAELGGERTWRVNGVFRRDRD